MRTTLLTALAIAVCAPFALLSQEKDVRALADSFADALAKLPKKTVAVVDFNDLQGNVTELGRYLAEQLSVSLAMTGKGIDVVDRSHLKALLQENKLGSSGIIDPTTARKLGQIAGVDVLITGTLTPFGDSVQLAVKALDASTAHVVTASLADVARTRAIDELLKRGIGAEASAPSRSAPDVVSPTRSADFIKTIGDVSLRLNRCGTNADGLVCEFLFTSQEGREYHIVGANRLTRAVDEKGTVYTARRLWLGDAVGSGGDGYYVKNALTAGIPMSARVLFVDAAPDGALLVSLEITISLDAYGNRGAIHFQFRNVHVGGSFSVPRAGRGGN